MKYEFISDFSGWKKGVVYNLESRLIVGTLPEELEHLGIVKKVEDKKKPKFRVGDYAVVVGSGRMLKVGHILPIDGEYKYEGYKEDKLRTPTKEELELYFR